jgi:hypothetical protein
MFTVLPADIRKTKQDVKNEQRAVKEELKARLIDRGEIAHIHSLLNKISPITYQSVVSTLNPNSATWSPRVIEFTRQYLATRDSLRASATQQPK